MTFQELLKACASGKMPRVKSTEHFKGHTSTTGTVTTIKTNGKHSGCAVTFDGMAYDTWFHEEWEEDKRSKYMNQLILLPNE